MTKKTDFGTEPRGAEPRRGAKRGAKRGAEPRRGTEPRRGEPQGERLQKVLARAGVSSRRGGEALIDQGRVKVNERVVTEQGVRVDPARDKIRVDGRLITMADPVYILLNKPDACVSSGEPDVDERGRPTVVSLLRGVDTRVYPVGRLDYHTRGVLLLTNDGTFAARLLHPRFKVPKTYHAKFQGRLTVAELDALRDGVTLDDGTRTQPLSEVLVVKETEANTWVQLTLTQGLYRQVRRMGDAIGHSVLKLLRVAFADLTADGVAEGDWRHLRPAELAELKSQTGGA